jgi:hypothetical protein
MNAENKERPVIVFSGTMWEAGLVKSLLENAEITAMFNNEIVGSNQGGIPIPFPGGNVSVVVSSTEYEIAMQVVKDYLANKIK